VGSGVNDTRPQLLALLADQSVGLIVVEHKGRLTRFGLRYLDTLLSNQGRAIEVVNEVVNQAENGTEDLLADLTAIVYSFCVRLYGQRRAKRKSEAIVRELEARGRAMHLVERHVIKRADPRFQAIDRAAFASKNLYNAANYELRQAYIFQGVYLSYPQMHQRMKDHEAYQALPAKVAQQVLRVLDKNWQSFFTTLAAWKNDPSTFLGRPQLPRYKDKHKGRNLLVYTIQALSAPALRGGVICPSMLGITVQTQQQDVQHVRIIPRIGFYVVEVVYEREPIPAAVNPELHAGVDIGLNNLATLTADKPGFVPRVVNGRPVKSINQFSNKRRAQWQSVLGTGGTSRRLERFTAKRTRRIDHYLHTASRRIIDLLVAEGIGTLCIGQNPLWKQEANMGKRGNQNVVSVPHARFIAMLSYKAALVGMHVFVTEESSTSKASFLDGDPLPIYNATDATQPAPCFSGKRVRRGLYRAADGRHINADVNGAYNIMRKVAPDAFAQGSRGCVVHPVRLAA
jgi:IS605 OrfB family transposase